MSAEQQPPVGELALGTGIRVLPIATANVPRSDAATASLQQQAFDRHPHGMLVLDRRGHVICQNLEANRLLGAIVLPETELTCCALLGCRITGSPLAEACLTELVVRRNAPLPGIRIDIPTSSGPQPIWVAATPLTHDCSRVVLQLRPGLAKDRRRRTHPHWMTRPRLRIRTLGNTEIESAEGPLSGDWLSHRSGQLLKYLIANRERTVTVDEIAEHVWPGARYATSGTVRSQIHELRSRLEPGRASRAPSTFITARAGSYQLDRYHIDLDVDDFQRHVAAGLAAVDIDSDRATVEIERGLALYTGEFLAGLPYAEWAMAERCRLHDLACTGLRVLDRLDLACVHIDGDHVAALLGKCHRERRAHERVPDGGGLQTVAWMSDTVD